MQTRFSFLLTLAAALCLTSAAHAHVGLAGAKGPAIENATDDYTFTIGHGCANSTMDTIRVEISIPAGVTGVRPLHGGVFGEPTIEYDAANPAVVTKVIWTKSTAPLAVDSQYYKFNLRMKMPATPWAKLSFRTLQVCKDADESGPAIVHDWGASIDEPAPVILVFPARSPGWNRYSVPHMEAADVPLFFKDAEVVWWNEAAYSSNPAIAELIAAEPGVLVLEGNVLHEADIWVKY